LDLGKSRSGEGKGDGGSARRLSPASGVLSTRAAYRPSYLAQRQRTMGWCLPRLESGRSYSGAGSTSRSGGGEGRSSWRGRRRAAPVALVPRVIVRARYEASREVRRAGTPTAARKRAEADSPTVATSGANPAAARAGVAGEGSGRLTGTETEPLRWILVGVVRRSCNSTAAQRSGAPAEQDARRARVTVAAADGRRKGGSGPYL